MAQISVKCNGYNGINKHNAKRDVIEFKTSGNCLFLSFHLVDKEGHDPPPCFKLQPVSFPAKSVCYDYTGEEIPSDGYFFSYTTDAMITRTVAAGPGVIVNIAAPVNGGVIFNIGGHLTAGDGSGVIKNK